MKIDVFLRPKKSSIFFAGEPYFEAYSNENPRRYPNWKTLKSRRNKINGHQNKKNLNSAKVTGCHDDVGYEVMITKARVQKEEIKGGKLFSFLPLPIQLAPLSLEGEGGGRP